MKNKEFEMAVFELMYNEGITLNCSHSLISLGDKKDFKCEPDTTKAREFNTLKGAINYANNN